MSGLEPDTARGGTDGTVKVKWVQPPPTVINREWLPTDPPMPDKAVALIKKAQAQGWVTRTTYAQGTHAPKRGSTEPTIVHSCVVRLNRLTDRPDRVQRAYGAWIGTTETTHAKVGRKPRKKDVVCTAPILTIDRVPMVEVTNWEFDGSQVLGGWLAPIVTELGVNLTTCRLDAFPFSISSPELNDFIALPPTHRVIVFDNQYERAADPSDFISWSLFKEFIGEPARLRAIANAEKAAKKAKASPEAVASLAETFDPIGDSP